MADFRPFRALRPPPELAADVVAPPYDVIDLAEARALAAGNPRSFLHVTRPEIDLPDGADQGSVHALGARALDGFARDGVLRPDPGATFSIYRQRMGDAVQTGVVGCAAVADYRSGVIATHEHTRPDKEADRSAHIDALGAHDEPVFLMTRRSPDVDVVVADAVRSDPALSLTTRDGVEHTVWIVDAPAPMEALRAAFAGLERLYVADGHHRSAAAARVHARRAGHGGEHDAFLAVAFPADELTVMAYNRVVADLAGQDPQEFLRALEKEFDVEARDGAVDARERGAFGMYLDGGWHLLRARPPRDGGLGNGVLGDELDVTLLQERVLAPLLRIDDPRTDPRIAFVGGIRGTAQLQQSVDSGHYAVAFALYPTSPAQVMAVADAGAVMPPKSTWFEPKLASGLFVHRY